MASDKEDQQDILIGKFAKIICSEVKQIVSDKSRYVIRITKENMSMSASPTVMDLLVALSANLKYTLLAILIGNIITNTVLSHNPTNLQTVLGNLIRDSKSPDGSDVSI